MDSNDIDTFSSSSTRVPCRTKLSGRYQSDEYTGLLSANRMYSNGQPWTRLEQLITLFHDDQIRALLLILRHYALKHQWTHILTHLKSLLQSSFCRSYLRLYWQLIFRYLLENFHSHNQIDMSFLSQIFDNLFHSPTINRTQAFYSYLCLHLINPHTIHLYIDMETRYKSLPQPFYSGRCKYVSYMEKFDPKLEQLLLIDLHFLYDYRQWLIDYSLIPTAVNPFVKTMNVSLENERDLEYWTFKLTTNFHEIQYLSSDYFDNYDIYLLKYLLFLYQTETNIEQIAGILDTYTEQHRTYINAYKYSYWFHLNAAHLKKLVELDPSSSPYVLIYCRATLDPSEIIDRLFDYLDYDKNKSDDDAWRLLSDTLLAVNIDDDRLVQCIVDNWSMRKTIWKKFHFRSFDKLDYHKACVAYMLLDDDRIRFNLREKYLNDERSEQMERLHHRFTRIN